MKLNIRILLIQIIVSIFSFEIFSFILLSTGLVPNIYHKSGFKKPKDILHQGLSWRTEEKSWGAWHKKNSISKHSRSCFNVNYESNNLGARDVEDYSKNFPKDSILALGDSFMEGYGLNHEDTLTFKIQKKIKKKVYNLSSSYDFGPLQYYLLYKSLGENLPHETVILTFLPMNDFVDNDYKNIHKMGENRFRPYYQTNKQNNDYKIIYPKKAKKTNSIGRNKFHAFMLSQAIRSNSVLLYKNIKLINKYKIKENKLSNFSFVNIPIEEQNAATHFVKKTYQLAKKRGIKNFIILSIPVKNDFKYLEDNNYPPTDKWEKDFKNLDINNKDFTYINGLEVVKKEFDKEYENLFLKCDGHWSKNGTEIYSDLLFSKLKEIL